MSLHYAAFRIVEVVTAAADRGADAGDLVAAQAHAARQVDALVADRLGDRRGRGRCAGQNGYWLIGGNTGRVSMPRPRSAARIRPVEPGLGPTRMLLIQ